MPRIQEYNLESEGQGPVGGLDPRIEAAGAVGQGVEKLGGAIEHEGEVIHRRQAQAEISALSAEVSQKHVDFNQQLQSQTADGSLDIDDFKQNLNDWSDEAGQGIQTAEGRDYFNRTAGKLKYALTQAAVNGSAQIAAKTAQNDYNTADNANSNVLFQDPSQFYNVLNRNEDFLDAQVSVNPRLAKLAPQMLRESNGRAAMASIQGWSRLGDTDQTDENGDPISGATIARHILDEGEYDKYLSPPQKEAMIKMLDQAEKTNSAQRSHDRVEAQQVAKQQFDQVLDKNIVRYQSGQLSPREVADWNLPPEAAPFKRQLIDKLNADAKRPQPVNNAVVADYVHRMTLPDDDPNKATVEQAWVDPNVRPQDAAHIQHFWDISPEGKELKADRNAAVSAAKTKFLHPKDQYGNPLPGAPDRYAEFTQDVRRLELQADQQKIPRKNLYDSAQPGNLYDLMNNPKYQVKNPLLEMAGPAKNAAAPPAPVPANADQAARLKAAHDFVLKKASERTKGGQ